MAFSASVERVRSVNASLYQSEEPFRTVFDNAGMGIAIITIDGKLAQTNSTLQQLLGYGNDELICRKYFDITHPDDLEMEQPLLQSCLEGKLNGYEVEKRFLSRDAQVILCHLTVSMLHDPRGQPQLAIATIQSRNAPYQTSSLLQQQSEQEQLLTNLTHALRQSLDLAEILTTTVNEVRQVLQADRVVIYQFHGNWSGVVTVESVLEPWTALLGTRLRDPCFAREYAELYQQGRFQATSDIAHSGFHPCHVELLNAFEVRASLVLPIILYGRSQEWQDPFNKRDSTPGKASAPVARESNPSPPRLWGLLIVHQCSQPRLWQEKEILLLKHLTHQVGVAIQQSELYQHVRQLNTTLERQVVERTARLQKALEFEATLKRITDKVRDSLDEHQILQTVVAELGAGLTTLCCTTSGYDANHTISTISHEYTQSIHAIQGQTIQMADAPDIYSQLLQGQWLQFCWRTPDVLNLSCPDRAILACPIFDDQGVMGDIWLFRDQEEAFHEMEVRLVQQVANQCAIAIRQARLYQTAQAQVTELKRLNHLKDDFLCTVSHELRTPMSNINLAMRMLEMLLRREGLLDDPTSQAHRYMQILQYECDREIKLINDLLDLQRLKANAQSPTFSIIGLQDWLPRIAEPFTTRISNQQQTLTLDIPPDLPVLSTDSSYLERILSELLNNACKYTPAGEAISLRVRQTHPTAMLSDKTVSHPQLLIAITNTGTEIPAKELPHIFEKFYRVPSTDPWKHGGTGLGLALIKQLAEDLGGSLEVESGSGQTTFTLTLPLTNC